MSEVTPLVGYPLMYLRYHSAAMCLLFRALFGFTETPLGTGKCLLLFAEEPGFSIFSPSNVVAKLTSPTSTPTASMDSGNTTGSISQTKYTNHLPEAKHLRVQVFTVPSSNLCIAALT